MSVSVDLLAVAPDHYRLKCRVSGRKDRYRTVRGTLAETETARAQWLAEVQSQGLAPVSPATTLGGWVRQYLAGRTELEARTQLWYSRLVDRFIDPAKPTDARTRRSYGEVDPDWSIGRLPLHRLMPVDCMTWQRLMLDRGVSVTQTSAAMDLAKRCCAEAVRLRVIRSNPFTDIRIARARRQPVAIPDTTDLNRIVSSVARAMDGDHRPDAAWRAERLGMLLHLALSSGARRGELLALTWREVDIVAGMLQIRHTLEDIPGEPIRRKPPKTAAGVRDVPIRGAALAALKTWRTRAAEHAMTIGRPLVDLPMLPDTDRVSWWSPAAASQLARRALHHAGIKTSLHSLRHSHATELLRGKIPVRAVSERLGHSMIETTLKHYQHAMRDDGEAAATAIAAIIEGRKA